MSMFIAEQLKMNDCYYDKRDWRSCKKEVSSTVISTIYPSVCINDTPF